MPRPIRKVVYYLFLLLVSSLAVVLLYVLGAFSIGLLPVNNSYEAPQKGIPIFVKSNGVHTDLVVPTVHTVIDWRDYCMPQDFGRVSQEAAYIAFGLGEKAFYVTTPTWDQLTFSTAFKAVLLPTASVMHVTYYENTPTESERSKVLVITEAQYELLVPYLLDTYQFATDTQRPVLLPHRNYTYNDNFYEAIPSYHLFYTCNDWVNEGLKKINVRTAWWSPFDKGILWYR